MRNGSWPLLFLLAIGFAWLAARHEPSHSGARVAPLADGASPSADAGPGARRDAFPPEKLRAGESRWALVIEDSGHELTDAEVRAALPAPFRTIPIVRNGARSSGALQVISLTAPGFRAPGEDELRYFARGLDAGDLARARAVKRGTLIGVTLPSGPRARELLGGMQRMAAQLARSRGGFVWDDVTRELFTPDSLEKRRVHAGALDVRDHVIMHAYRDGELTRVITLGMEKFGLPDLVVEEASDGKGVGQIVNLAAQLLLEGANLSAGGKLQLDLDALKDPDIRRQMTGQLLDGATRKAEVKALQGRAEKGDPENVLLELWFGEPPPEKQDAVAARIWGVKDEVINARTDPALAAESAREREKLLREVKPLFLRGELSARHLSVKLPFRDGKNTEWMWVEVVRWQGSEVRGILRNQPQFMRGLASGAQVAGDESEIFDYILSLPDGGTEGNTTGALILARQKR